MPTEEQRFSLAYRLLPLIALLLFTAALWVLHDALRHYHYHQILARLQAIPASHVLAALGLTALSYWVMTGYDRLAIVYIRHPLDARRATLASFISYAFSNTVGFSLLTSGSIRYRLYSTWGLSAEEIARLFTFTTLTFWLGIATVTGIAFIVEPMALPLPGPLGGHASRLAGWGLVFLVIGYLSVVTVRKRPIQFRNWTLPLPSLPLAGAQLLIAALDWILAGCVLFVLLPDEAGLSLARFIEIFLLAQGLALLSNIPGGLGVFESVILLAVPQLPADALVGSMVVYRILYYLLPLVLATLLLGANELLLKKTLVTRAVRLADRWWGVMIPPLLATTTLVSGAVLLFSGATPTVPARMNWLSELLPLPVFELSHFLGSIIGVCLLLLARGLQRRIDAAYMLAAVLLGAGSLLCLVKGIDYEEAALLALMLLALLPCRRHFYRRASLFQGSFSLGWSITILLVLTSFIWLGTFAHKHVAYSSELWWQFALKGDAPRFLRASVGATALLLALTTAKLLRAAPKDPILPGEEELARARNIIDRSPVAMANLALLGDKELLFDTQDKGFAMYGVEGRTWIALGDPVGPPEVSRELAWAYRELVERHGGQPVFYEVGTSMLHVYLDMGLTLFKLGEQARVPLEGFTLEGRQYKDLRYIHRRLTRDGCQFEILPAESLPELLPALRAISDAWLREKNTREKRFSLGCFDEKYLRHFPVAVVRQHDEIAAFANLWTGADRQELSFDLMRFAPQAPKGVMDYLFVSLMLWGKEQGYQSLDLGMAPLSGLDNRPFAPLWNRIGAVIFQHGEHFYNFEGLRKYKQKFDPIWEPRYLACPGGFLTLPQTLLNVAALISGGLKGVIAK